MKVRVRFAPSPTGFLHIGNLRAALYDYLFARHHGGTFIVRIEDTDQTRLVPGGLENILKTLEWAGLTWDEGPFIEKGIIIEKGDKGPYVQSKRLEIYRRYADELLEKGHAYYCFCTSDRLNEMRTAQMAAKLPPMYDGRCRDLAKDFVNSELKKGTPHVIRLRVPKEGETIITDTVYGEVHFENKLVDDQVLMKSDGFPTYHLANVVDDHLMEITQVIRGEEWMSSTPKHVLLYDFFGWDKPQFSHLPLLLNSDRSKLSKRTGDVAVESYREKGYLPETIVNFVALLGWNPRADQEIYSLEALVKEFALDKMNRGGAVVNFEKLKWLNSEYIRKKTVTELTRAVLPWLEKAEYLREEGIGHWFAPQLDQEISWNYLEQVTNLAQERLEILSDIGSLVDFFFVEPNYQANLLQWKNMTKDELVESLEKTENFITAIDDTTWNQSKLEQDIKQWITIEELNTGRTLWPLRVALTGREASPGPFEVAGVLGKERTLVRLKKAIELAKSL